MVGSTFHPFTSCTNDVVFWTLFLFSSSAGWIILTRYFDIVYADVPMVYTIVLMGRFCASTVSYSRDGIGSDRYIWKYFLFVNVFLFLVGIILSGFSWWIHSHVKWKNSLETQVKRAILCAYVKDHAILEEPILLYRSSENKQTKKLGY